MNLTNQDLAEDGAALPSFGEASSPHPVPRAAGELATAVITVEPHLVEHGDIILGLRTPVTSILTDGTFWFYGDDSGTFIAKRPSWGRVQVIRGADQEMIAQSLADLDDCNPAGLERPPRQLTVVRP